MLLLLFIASSPKLFSQDIPRIKISGEIHVPQNEDAEGISVFNISTQKGTITNADGVFEIEIAENDHLQITALQYQSFTVVVDKNTVEHKTIDVFLNPAVNQLEEVLVRTNDLTGNINVDVKKIAAENLTKDMDLSYGNLKNGFYIPDDNTSLSSNAAEEGLNSKALKDGANFKAMIVAVTKLIFPNSNKTSVGENRKDQADINYIIEQRFGKDFITENFDIAEDKIVDFLFYAQENGLDQDLLKPANELKLMEFLFRKGKEYKKIVE